MIKLSEKERDAMAHCIGHHSSKSCSIHGGRNYYAAAFCDEPMWLSLVARGLAYPSSRNEGTFHLNDNGINAVEADPRSQRKGRAYIIKFSNGEKSNEIYAETRSKAQFIVAQSISDAQDCSIREALKLIKSCCLAKNIK